MTTDTRAFSSCSSTRTPPPAVQQWLCRRPPALPGWNEPNSALCHRIRPPPARRRRIRRPFPSIGLRSGSVAQKLSLVLLFCLLFVCRGTNAQSVYGESEVFPRELLFDRSEPPPLPGILLERRQEGGDESSSMIPSTTIRPTNNDASSSTATTTATGSGLATASQTAPADLPRPFDTSLGNNFTSTTCPTFFSSFLNNQTFKNCLPLSLLLQTSNSFFTASRSLVRLSQTLDATCNVDFNTCSILMASLAQEIQKDAQCGADLEMENPLVTQAYNGFEAYPTLYHAGCLTDNDGKYCFANAVTNASAPSSSYIYYLPLGVQLPGGAKPACNQCLQNTMAIFATTASNSSQPLSKDYTGAAEQVQMTCGPTFVEASVATSAASTPITTSTTLAGALVLLTLITNLF